MTLIRRMPAVLALTLVATGMSACGGGGAGNAAPTYKVSTTVSGLSAPGLVLELNAGSDLAVPKDGTATFPSTLTAGTTYSITVKTQPATQLCTVTNGSGTITSNVANVAVNCVLTTPDLSAGGANVVGVTVGPGPGNNINMPYVSVTVCASGTSTCKTINDVLVDTGSTGLRLFASVLAATPALTLAPANASQPLGECGSFADGYTWGPVAVADVQIGGESAKGVPVQIMDDTGSAFAAMVPSSCTGTGVNLDSTTAFGANGVLGVGLFEQDCGQTCATVARNGSYYSCSTATSSCQPTTVAESAQVTNPVALMAADNNGIVLQMPSVGATGVASVQGYMAFGIGTRANNFLGTVTVLTADGAGNIITLFNGQALSESFIDSGSNTLAFTDSAIPTCTGKNQTSFYCPTAAASLTATNQGHNGNTTTVNFTVGNFTQVTQFSSAFAFNNIGATLAKTPLTNAFDWGLPFFYGRTVYFALEDRAAGSGTGPYYAY